MAQQTDEARLHLFIREETLGLVPGVFFVTIEQHLCGIDQKLCGRFACVNREEFESCALIVIEFDLHQISVRGQLAGFQ